MKELGAFGLLLTAATVLLVLYVDLRRSLVWVSHQAGKIGSSSVTFDNLRDLMDELKTQETELVETAAIFEHLVQVLPLPVLIHHEGVVLYANDAFVGMARAGNGLVTMFDFIVPKQRRDLFFKMQEIYEERVDEVFYIVKVIMPDMTSAYVETRTIRAFFKGKRAALTVIGNVFNG